MRRRGLVACIIILIVLLPASLAVGTTHIGLNTIVDAIINFDPSNNDHLFVRHLRIPRTLLAILVGCALGVAGAVMQAITRNPLAEPGILGVNAGAAVSIIIAIAVFGFTSVTAYMWFGLLGAAIAGAGVYLLGGVRRGTNPVRLVLAGAALTVVLQSITQLIVINNDESVFNSYRHWVVGSLQGRGYDVLGPIALLVVVGVVIALSMARALDTAALGQDLSQALGVSPVRVWGGAAIVVIVLAGGATAAAGPIAFVGLTAPHIARYITGPSHRWLLPYSMLVAALLVLIGDIAGRLVAHPHEVGVGIMVALIGGPFFVALVRRKKLVQL